LTQDARYLKLRPAYYPFWTFDGILEAPWSCEVNEGSSRNPYWVPRNGTEFETFDDLLVSGLKALDEQRLAQVAPFQLKNVVEFNPEFLAGWQALTYDLPMSDASLKAREKVMNKLRRSLYSRVEPGREKRNLKYGAGQWSAQTFKLAMLPLWVGTYEYKGKSYPLLVNGQTGKVGGTKPRDLVKILMILTGALVLVAVVIFLLYQLYLIYMT